MANAAKRGGPGSPGRERDEERKSSDRSTLRLTNLHWLASLVRMQIKRIERDIAKVAPRPGQSAEEFESFCQALEKKASFSRETLAAIHGEIERQIGR